MTVLATREPVPTSPMAAPEEALYEIVNGQRVELPPMRTYASMIASRLHIRLGAFVETMRLGRVPCETIFILDADKDLRRRPDVAFVSATNWPLDRPEPQVGDWEVAPDLAVEVVGPIDSFQSVLAKMRDYFDHGVREVWIVVPSVLQVHVYKSPDNNHIISTPNDLVGGDIVPGFRMPLADLFGTNPVKAQQAAT